MSFASSSPEPFVILPDGEHSQVLALVGDKLERRAGLPWRYEGSLFGSDGEHVGCIESLTNRGVDGLCLTTRASWRLPPGHKSFFRAFVVARGNIYATQSKSGSARLVSARIAALGARDPGRDHASRLSVPSMTAPTIVVDVGHTVLALSDGAFAHLAHPLPEPGDVELRPAHRLPATVEGESIRAATVAERYLVVVAGTAAADSIAVYDKDTLACVVRLARDAVIPRFVAGTVVENRLVVADDRPGVMVAPLAALVAAAAGAASSDDGGRLAANALRASWSESPVGAIREFTPVPGTSKTIALVAQGGTVSAVVLSHFAARNVVARARLDRWTD